MNNVNLMGKLTRDPELKTTNSGLDVMSFSVAVNRSYKKQGEEVQADFINCVAWQQTAVFISTYFHKGDGIVLNGRLESRKYVDNDGNNRTVYEVVVEHVEFPLSRKNQTASPPAQTGTAATQDDEPKNWAAMDTDDTDDLPF